MARKAARIYSGRPGSHELDSDALARLEALGSPKRLGQRPAKALKEPELKVFPDKGASSGQAAAGEPSPISLLGRERALSLLKPLLLELGAKKIGLSSQNMMLEWDGKVQTSRGEISMSLDFGPENAYGFGGPRSLELRWQLDPGLKRVFGLDGQGEPELVVRLKPLPERRGLVDMERPIRSVKYLVDGVERELPEIGEENALALSQRLLHVLIPKIWPKRPIEKALVAEKVESLFESARTRLIQANSTAVNA